MPDSKAARGSEAEAEGPEGRALLFPFALRGLALFVGLGLSLLAVVFATGELEQFLEGDVPLWADRNARLAVLGRAVRSELRVVETEGAGAFDVDRCRSGLGGLSSLSAA